jgi:radical SAM protein with 4Fe4S-binding SPASM domain
MNPLSNHTRTMVLQWHITERCNLKCTHCYQDQPNGDELDFGQLCQIIEQFKALIKNRQRNNGNRKVRGLINVTGGEPFVRGDFFDLLERFAQNRDHFRFGILTNGTLIDARIARRLDALKPAFVQVSLEGSRNTNDAIRGGGTFDRVTKALKHLMAQGIRTHVSFTAHRQNYNEFAEVAAIGCQLGVSRVWADRLIPYGSGSLLDKPLLTPEETRHFFEVMYAAHNKSQRHFCDTEISMHRALQFLVGGGNPYHCEAGDWLIALQADGELVPCRRMPIGVGNVLEIPLADLYAESELFQKLRDHGISHGCEPCGFNRKCGGGLRCLAYAVYGDPFRADPGCWRASAIQ